MSGHCPSFAQTHCFSCSSDKFSGAYVIIKEYKELFTPGGDEIESVVKDPSLKILSEVRHLIVHRASRFDEKYLAKLLDLPQAPKGSIGEELLLDYELVHNLLGPVCSRSVALIGEVDAWLGRRKRHDLPSSSTG